MTPTETIDLGPARLNREAVLARLRLSPARAAEMDVDGLLATAESRLRLRAVVADLPVRLGEEGDTVEIGRQSFRSRVLRRCLDGAERVFPFVLTAGPGLEAAAAAADDLFRQFALETVADLALEDAGARLAEILRPRAGGAALSSLSPGALEDWPIADQPALFSLFDDVAARIGVRLTGSLLMIPRKSVSGLLFPSPAGFTACGLCERAGCPSRRTPAGSGGLAQHPRRLG